MRPLPLYRLLQTWLPRPLLSGPLVSPIGLGESDVLRYALTLAPTPPLESDGLA